MGVVQAPLFPVACGGMIGNWFPVSGWAFPNGLTLGASAGNRIGICDYWCRVVAVRAR